MVKCTLNDEFQRSQKFFFRFFCFIYNIIHVEVKKPKINPEMALQERKKEAKSDPLLIKTKAFSHQSLCQSSISLSIVVAPFFVITLNRFLSREFVEWQ